MSASALAIALMLGNAPVGPFDTSDGASTSTPIAAEPETASTTAETMAQTGSDPDKVQPGRGQPDQDQEDITVTARRGHAPGDPLERVNEQSFAAMQAVDRAVVGPVAHVYEHAVPKPARNGLRNFFRNLHEPIVFANFLIQLKPGKAMETLGRFALNSTVGVAGVIDVAKTRPFNLPFRPNGFANSLGFYGVKPGPFLVLPLIGPTTLRDLVGRAMDTVIYPLPGGRPISGTAYAVSSTTVKMLNRRVDFDGTLHDLRDGNPHAYASMREYYLQGRAAEIAALHGRPRFREGAPVELTGPISIPPSRVP